MLGAHGLFAGYAWDDAGFGGLRFRRWIGCPEVAPALGALPKLLGEAKAHQPLDLSGPFVFRIAGSGFVSDTSLMGEILCSFENRKVNARSR